MHGVAWQRTLGIIDSDVLQPCLGHPDDAFREALDEGSVSGGSGHDDGYAFWGLGGFSFVLLPSMPWQKPQQQAGCRPWQQ